MSALDMDEASAHLDAFPDHSLIMILTSTSVVRYGRDDDRSEVRRLIEATPTAIPGEYIE